jgi:hypothetical protein
MVRLVISDNLGDTTTETSNLSRAHHQSRSRQSDCLDIPGTRARK